MTKRSVSDRADIFARDVQAIVQERADLSANDERLGSTRTRAIADIFHRQADGHTAACGCVASVMRIA